MPSPPVALALDDVAKLRMNAGLLGLDLAREAPAFGNLLDARVLVPGHVEASPPHVRLVRKRLHSMTSSARSSSAGGMGRPRALAVRRLMARSNVTGCSTGRSAGLAPLRILSTYTAARRYRSAAFTPYDINPPARTKSCSMNMVGRR